MTFNPDRPPSPGPLFTIVVLALIVVVVLCFTLWWRP